MENHINIHQRALLFDPYFNQRDSGYQLKSSVARLPDDESDASANLMSLIKKYKLRNTPRDKLLIF